MTQRHGSPRASVWALPLDTSGCGACQQSIAALQAPRYSRETHAAGLRFARSPRHADVILLTGALTEMARGSVARVLAAVPQPHALIAIGDCAIDGCVFAGSPHLVASVAETFDAHVEIAGCPPAPLDILAAILEAKRLLANDDNDDERPDDREADDTGVIDDEKDEGVEA